MSAPDVSVILLMFNEAPNVQRMVEDVRVELEGADITWDIVCMDDGSTDRTAALLLDAGSDVVVVRFTRNLGKEAEHARRRRRPHRDSRGSFAAQREDHSSTSA